LSLGNEYVGKFGDNGSKKALLNFVEEAWFKNTLFRVTLKNHRQKDALLQTEAKIKTQCWREKKN